MRLGVDAKKSDQQVRGSTVLPAGTGKSVRVAVFAPAGAKADEARAAGAEAVGMDDLAETMQAGDLTTTSSSRRRMRCAWSASSASCSVRAA